MTKRIFHSILFAAVSVLLASMVIIMGFLYDYFGDVQERQLGDELAIAAGAVEKNGETYLTELKQGNYRITWVAQDGSVIYDSEMSAESMENHGDREEILEALEHGSGKSSRYSATLTQKTIYNAVRLSDGTVLRMSVSRMTILTLVLGMLQPIVIVVIFALALSGALAKRMSKRIVTPLNKLDLEHPLENDAYDELSPLLNHINQQHWQISSQLRELKQKTDEFEQITGNMSECLVLLDDAGSILSINPAAQRLFNVTGSCVGNDFLTVERSRGMRQAVQTALRDGHSEICMERNGLEYQFNISRIESEGVVVGAVILAFDVTEKEFLERSRREFTANVSHELKTPLQTIIGSAELIENGMVKADDMPRFVGHIRQEAARLVTLIDDIIRLSQLDEGKDLPRDTVDLLEVGREAIADLQSAADERDVTISLTGGSAEINGVRRLIYEIIYNLCDNAVKYNKKGGLVELSVFDGEKEAGITVKDTGVGIAPEHQGRVFERFYRVDKSHSKRSGGTGLGLSIVKHAAQYHHARVTLKSSPGEGTEISVIFPK